MRLISSVVASWTDWRCMGAVALGFLISGPACRSTTLNNGHDGSQGGLAGAAGNTATLVGDATPGEALGGRNELRTGGEDRTGGAGGSQNQAGSESVGYGGSATGGHGETGDAGELASENQGEAGVLSQGGTQQGLGGARGGVDSLGLVVGGGNSVIHGLGGHQEVLTDSSGGARGGNGGVGGRLTSDPEDGGASGKEGTEPHATAGEGGGTGNVSGPTGGDTNEAGGGAGSVEAGAGNGGSSVAGAGGAVAEPQCEMDQRLCNGTCIALSACCSSSECPSGNCVDHVCACAENERPCGEACIPAQDCCTDDECPTGGSCDSGSCHCPESTHQCGDACVSNTDPETCGQSCDPCVPPTGGTATCDGTQCLARCGEGQQLCAGECIDAAAACDGDCPSGTHNCSELCVDDDSVNGCGAACTPCPVPAYGVATCEQGQCGFECTALPNYEACGSECIPMADCCEDAECGTDRVCDGGTCQCADGLEDCRGVCIPSTDCCEDAECGTDRVCNGGTCQCADGLEDCRGVCIPSTDCCEDAECGTDRVCDGGTCQCAAGLEPCGEACIPAGGCCQDGDCEGEATCNGSHQCVCDSYYYGSGCDHYFRALGYSASTHSEGEATAVSADGNVVVGWSKPSAGNPEAFRWENGVNEGLGKLADASSSTAVAVSGDGSVVVGNSEVVDGAGLVVNIAFQWVEGEGISSLGVLNYGTYSFAWDVSRDGQVVCGDGDRDTEPRGIRWVGRTPTSMQYDFDPFWALGANQDGSILVGRWFNQPAVVSFSGSDATPSNLPLGGSTSGAAVAVSDDGQTVLGWLDAEDQAYLWSASGSPQELGDFLPWDLSGNGAVAVGEIVTSERVAVLWDASHGLRTLSDVLAEAGVPIENWNLWRATGVSADGKTIVGSGRNGSRTEGFIVRLP